MHGKIFLAQTSGGCMNFGMAICRDKRKKPNPNTAVIRLTISILTKTSEAYLFLHSVRALDDLCDGAKSTHICSEPRDLEILVRSVRFMSRGDRKKRCGIIDFASRYPPRPLEASLELIFGVSNPRIHRPIPRGS